MIIFCRITYDEQVDDINCTIIYIYLSTLISCGLIWYLVQKISRKKYLFSFTQKGLVGKVSLPLSASQLAEVLPPGRGPFLKRRPLRLRLPKEPLGYPGKNQCLSRIRIFFHPGSTTLVKTLYRHIVSDRITLEIRIFKSDSFSGRLGALFRRA
jgi:hypothetical protein